MTTFSGALQPFPASISAINFPAAIEQRLAQIVGVQAGATPPSVRSHGTQWYALSAVGRADGIYWFNSSLNSGAGDWVFSYNPASGRLIQAGATVGGTLSMGGFALTGLAHSTAGDSAARRDRAVDPQSPQIFNDLNMADGAGNFRQLINTGVPTAASNAMRRADFVSGVATLGLVTGADSTTGDVDLGFVPRALWLQLREASLESVSQLQSLHAAAVVVAQPLSGSFTAGLLFCRPGADGTVTPFSVAGTLAIVNATARGFRLSTPRLTSPVGGVSFGSARGLTGAVHWMAWR